MKYRDYEQGTIGPFDYDTLIGGVLGVLTFCAGLILGLLL